MPVIHYYSIATAYAMTHAMVMKEVSGTHEGAVSRYAADLVLLLCLRATQHSMTRGALDVMVLTRIMDYGCCHSSVF